MWKAPKTPFFFHFNFQTLRMQRSIHLYIYITVFFQQMLNSVLIVLAFISKYYKTHFFEKNCIDIYNFIIKIN